MSVFVYLCFCTGQWPADVVSDRQTDGRFTEKDKGSRQGQGQEEDTIRSLTDKKIRTKCTQRYLASCTYFAVHFAILSGPRLTQSVSHQVICRHIFIFQHRWYRHDFRSLLARFHLFLFLSCLLLIQQLRLLVFLFFLYLSSGRGKDS